MNHDEHHENPKHINHTLNQVVLVVKHVLKNTVDKWFLPFDKLCENALVRFIFKYANRLFFSQSTH